MQLGWEVRLEINGDLQRSEVFRSQGTTTFTPLAELEDLVGALHVAGVSARSADEVLATHEQWTTTMIEKGWRD